MRKVEVVGIGADGWDGLPPATRADVLAADVVLGGERHLASLPEVAGQRRVPWPSPLRDRLPGLLTDLDGRRVVVLASGDPLVFGIGSTLVDLLGADRVAITPALSSVALARAWLGWPAEGVVVLRDHRAVPRHLAPGRRILVLSADGTTPGVVADVLRRNGFGRTVMTVLADLGAPTEAVSSTVADEWTAAAAPPLHVLALECVGTTTHGLLAGLPDDAFEHDGQLTKRDLRASALARLAPQPGQLLWDVGAGAGSVAIEWLRADPTCRAIAVERDEDRAARIERNALALGTPTLRVVVGSAPDALRDLPTPDAVFVGGGVGTPGLLDVCWAALAPGGRLVAHSVTVESETALAVAHSAYGGELTRHHVERVDVLGSFRGWAPARAVTQWAATR